MLLYLTLLLSFVFAAADLAASEHIGNEKLKKMELLEKKSSNYVIELNAETYKELVE